MRMNRISTGKKEETKYIQKNYGVTYFIKAIFMFMVYVHTFIVYRNPE